jgi:hypothetical protein
MDFFMSILDFDGFLIWVSMDFWFGFCAAVLSLTLLMNARENNHATDAKNIDFV